MASINGRWFRRRRCLNRSKPTFFLPREHLLAAQILQLLAEYGALGQVTFTSRRRVLTDMRCTGHPTLREATLGIAVIPWKDTDLVRIDSNAEEVARRRMAPKRKALLHRQLFPADVKHYSGRPAVIMGLKNARRQ